MNWGALFSLRVGWICVISLGVLAGGASGALAQPGQGTLAGTVSDANGPVAGVEIQLVGQTNNTGHTYSAADGSYSLEAWPDTYNVGFAPPAGSSRGFSVIEGVTVAHDSTTTANGFLAPTPSSGHVYGNASYADHGPDAGVQVNVTPMLFHEGSVGSVHVETDEAGNWDLGQVPAGFYSLSYSTFSTSNFQNLGYESLLVKPGSQNFMTKELVGEKPPGTLIGSVIGPEGWPVERAQITGGGTPIGSTNDAGSYHTALPPGNYTLTASGGGDSLPGSASISIQAGMVNHLDIQLAAKPVPAGTPEGVQAQQLAWFNAQRAQWGLPAGVVNVPLWSRACAAHNAYEDLHDKMDHPETPGQAGYSEGGDWAGTHAVIAVSGGWGPEENPWNDAPIHLNQMMAAELSAVGIDVSHGYSCLTTWPGLRRKLPVGEVYTYPGNGTTGIPPAEFASELPTTPNKALGIPDLAGRHLFVYEGGLDAGLGGDVHIESASLSSSAGPVAIKWMDPESLGYLIGGDIVPLKPLEPFTTYTAKVQIAAVDRFIGPDAPAVTHTWSFTTGKANPHGYWNEGNDSGSRRKAVHRKPSHHHPTLKLRKRGDHMLAIGAFFQPKKKVTLWRQPGTQLIKQVKPNRKGKFQVSLKWGHLPTLTVIAKQGKKTVKARMKATGGD
jgi:hypothetical protein